MDDDHPQDDGAPGARAASAAARPEPPEHIDRLPMARVAYRAVLLAALLVLLALVFKAVVSLIIAALVTIILAIPLSACAARAERLGLPRTIGALVGLLAGLGVIAGVLAVVIPRFSEQATQLADQIPGIVRSLEGSVSDLVGTPRKDVAARLESAVRTLADNPGTVLQPLAAASLTVLGLATTLVFILITAFYTAINPEPLVRGALRLFPPDRREWARGVLARVRRAWIGWMQGVAFDMLISGVLLYIGLQIIGLDFAIVFALLTALLVVVPYFGSIIGAVPPVLFALSISPGKALLTLGVYVLVQQIEGNVIIPLIMANRVQLHPAVIAVGVIVVGTLFGFIGLLIAVPLLSALIIVVEEVWVRPLEAGQPAGRLPSSRPRARRLPRLRRAPQGRRA
jgi:predicted PurR-regulated permease PerM